MKINDRLKTIGDLVKANSFCLDVGCDHALLDIYLVKKNIGIKAIASDVLIGPVNSARENIRREGLEGKIEVRLGDGLSTYSSGVDTVIVSGMGGRTMVKIFSDNIEVLEKIETIIISPNNYQEEVKRFLCSKGFLIDNEVMVKEGKFIYQIIEFIRGSSNYSDKEYFFGPVFLEKKGELFFQYYQKELTDRMTILEKMPERFADERNKILEEIELLKEEL